MKTMPIQTILRTAVLSSSLALMAIGQAVAAENNGSGVVVMTIGQVTAQGRDGKERSLQRRSPIFPQETINTAAGGRAQLRLTDGSLISLQEKSSFKIASYTYGDKGGKGDNAAYDLLKGGMRTISGAIGKTNHSDYKVSTPVATIGIRGTDYELVLHEAGEGKGTELYGYINDGVINVANEGGDDDFGFNQFFVVSDAKHSPKQLLNPPDFMFEGYVPPHRGDGYPMEQGIDSGLSSGIERVVMNSDNSHFDINNPLFTPFSTVERLTGAYRYLSSSPPTVLNSTLAVISYSNNVSIDFSSQTITGVSISAILSDQTTINGAAASQSILLSDVAGGQAFALTGACSGTSCKAAVGAVPYPMAGQMSFQLIGAQARAAIGSYTLQQTVTDGLGITDIGLYTAQ